jgi:hypothetical protein
MATIATPSSGASIIRALNPVSIMRLGEALTALNQCDGLEELYAEGLLMAQQSGSHYLVEEFTRRLAALQQDG